MEIVDENGKPQKQYNTQDSKRILVGLLGIFFGSFGVHKFVLGYTKEGFIQLILSFISLGMLGIIGFIEGIIYLTKSDEEFVKIYQNNAKRWF